MVALRIVEDRPTPKEVYGWRVYFCAAVAAVAAIGIGYDTAFIGTSISLASYKEEFGLNTSTPEAATRAAFLSANIVSLYQAGCFFGALSGLPVGFYLGRKWGLIFTSIIFIIGVIPQCVANKHTGLAPMYAGRVILGYAIGIASNLTPIYISEISPAAIRGRLIGLYELGWQIGAVVGFFINLGINKHIPKSNKQWIIAFAVQIIPAGLLAIGSLFISESPRWLASRDRNTQALKSLAWLRNLPEDHPYVQEEYEDICLALEHDRSQAGSGISGPVKSLFGSRNYIKRLLIGVALFACQNGTGINAINYYSPTVFKSIGVTGTNNSLLTTGIFGLIKFAGAIVWLLFLVDRFGRRPVLFAGAIGGGLSMYYIGAYIAIADPAKHVSNHMTSGGISAMAFFYIWTIFYGPTWNGTPWVFGAEVFPNHVRPASQAIISASNWLFAFIVARFTPQAFMKMGYGFFLFFATFMMISIPFVFFIVPETKSVPLERMNELFAPGMKPWKAHGILMSRARGEATHERDLNGSTSEGDMKKEEDFEEEV